MINKMYEKTKQRIKNLTIQEPDLFTNRRHILNKEYIEKINEVVLYYPTYKLNENSQTTTKYTTLISILGGIGKQLDALTQAVQEKIKNINISLISGSSEIKNLEKILTNLNNYTDFDGLDASSKKMLLDYSEVYNTQRKLFWIKVTVLGVLLYLLVFQTRNYVYAIAGIGGIIILYIITGIRSYFKSQTSMPSANKTEPKTEPNVEPEPTCSPTCGTTEFGCCPDGITVSNSDRLNC